MRVRLMTHIFVLCLATVCRALIRLPVSPLKLYATAGNNGLPQVIHYTLASLDPGEILWKLINHKSIDFRLFWDQTCDVLTSHPLWYPSFEAKNYKFMTPHCLANLRSYDLKRSEALLVSSDTRPELDLRSFRNFCPFGHDDGFAEAMFIKAAWGFGPSIPDGQWCSVIRWRSYYPSDLWPIFDLECIEALGQTTRVKIPIVELISEQDNWSIFSEIKDYRLATFRYLHFESIKLQVDSRPWLSRWQRRMNETLDRLNKRMPFLRIVDDPWFRLFNTMVEGTWSIKILRDTLIPSLRASNDIKRSFQNRMILFYMTQIWRSSNVSVESITYIKQLYLNLLRDSHSNVVYLSRFLEVIAEISLTPAFQDMIKLTLINYKPASFDEADHISFTLWEIFFRYKASTYRIGELLDMVPLSIRSNVALKSLRHVGFGDRLNLWARVPGYREASQQDTFWATDPNFVPSTLIQFNHHTLSTAVEVLGKAKIPKLTFGLAWSEPAMFISDFDPPESHLETCHVLEAILRHFLFEIDYRGPSHAYGSSLGDSGKIFRSGCSGSIMNTLLALFSWRCKVPEAMLPRTEIFADLLKADKSRLTENWMSAHDFYRILMSI